jgi:hypothetical protein
VALLGKGNVFASISGIADATIISVIVADATIISVIVFVGVIVVVGDVSAAIARIVVVVIIVAIVVAVIVAVFVAVILIVVITFIVVAVIIPIVVTVVVPDLHTESALFHTFWQNGCCGDASALVPARAPARLSDAHEAFGRTYTCRQWCPGAFKLGYRRQRRCVNEHDREGR